MIGHRRRIVEPWPHRLETSSDLLRSDDVADHVNWRGLGSKRCCGENDSDSYAEFRFDHAAETRHRKIDASVSHEKIIDAAEQEQCQKHCGFGCDHHAVSGSQHCAPRTNKFEAQHETA